MTSLVSAVAVASGSSALATATVSRSLSSARACNVPFIFSPRSSVGAPDNPPDFISLRSRVFSELVVTIVPHWRQQARTRVSFQEGQDDSVYFDIFKDIEKHRFPLKLIAAWLKGAKVEYVKKTLTSDTTIRTGNYKDAIVLQTRDSMLAALPQATINKDYDDTGEPTAFYLKSTIAPAREISVDVQLNQKGEVCIDISLGSSDKYGNGNLGCSILEQHRIKTMASALRLIVKWLNGMNMENFIQAVKTTPKM